MIIYPAQWWGKGAAPLPIGKVMHFSALNRSVAASGCVALFVRLDMLPTTQRDGKLEVQTSVGVIFLGGEFNFSKTNSSQIIS